MSGINYLTQEGHDKLQAELEQLKTVGRKQASAAIAEAREKGDLSENAEYDAAKDAQGMLEAKINELEMSLVNVRILDESQIDTSEVRLLSKVTIKNLKNKMQLTYKLVSEAEANVKELKISASSPIGKGLIGSKKGEIATIVTPAGEMKFEIIDISV